MARLTLVTIECVAIAGMTFSRVKAAMTGFRVAPAMILLSIAPDLIQQRKAVAPTHQLA